MKILKQPKAQMHASAYSAEAVASKAVGRETGGASVSALPLPHGKT